MNFEIRDTAIEKNVLVKYEGTEEKVVVPNEAKIIKGIRNNNSVVELILPDGLEQISWHGIENCENLKSISIPDNVFLSKEFVSGCPALTTLIFRGVHYKNNPGGVYKCPKCHEVIISEEGFNSEVDRSTPCLFWEDFSSRTKFYNHNGARLLTPKEQSIEKGKERLNKQDNPLGKEFIAANKWGVKKGFDLNALKGSLDQKTRDEIQFVIYSYGKQLAKSPTYHAASYKKDIVPVSISKEADEIAKKIPKKALTEAINLKQPCFEAYHFDINKTISVPLTENMKIFENYEPYYLTSQEGKNLEFLLPLCRYANSKEIEKLIRSAEYLMKKMSTPGRKVAIAIRSALLLSDTKEAMDYLKKYGQLKLYAEIRGKTEDEVEKTLGSTKTALKADGSLAFDI